MFHDPTIVGSWPALAARLDGDAILVRWAAAEPALAGLGSVHDLLAVWAEGGADDRRDVVLAALVRLAAVDGGRDDDALILTLHLLSGLVRTMARQLADLNPDIVAVVVGELACQIRRYPWRRRPRAIAANLRAETRRAVLAELRLSSRYHPDRVRGGMPGGVPHLDLGGFVPPAPAQPDRLPGFARVPHQPGIRVNQ